MQLMLWITSRVQLTVNDIIVYQGLVNDSTDGIVWAAAAFHARLRTTDVSEVAMDIHWPLLWDYHAGPLMVNK